VILDTKGNIFGGFTPVEWKSRTLISRVHTSSCYKSDDSLKSFLFTLKNPHHIPARRFALKAEMTQYAIFCESDCGPIFGGGCDIAIDDGCNTYTNSSTSFGWSYTNDTGLDGDIVFTGSSNFRVAEIEVFDYRLKSRSLKSFSSTQAEAKNREIEKTIIAE
jgi:hypothetical protein